jgi:Tol biopolymer transport system component
MKAIVLMAVLAGVAAQAQDKAPDRIVSPAQMRDASLTSALIPRSVLFGNPDKISPQISPDGKWITFIAPVNGVLNVWAGPSDRIDAAKPITKDTGRGIRMASWAFDNAHVLYTQDEGGDENWKVYSVEVATANAKDLTPFDSIPGRTASR